MKRRKTVSVILAVAVVGLLLGIAYQYAQMMASKAGADARVSAEKWLANCADEACIKTGLERITDLNGPSAALEALDFYINKVPGSLSGDDHLRAHHVGRQTAVTFGLTGEAFGTCPQSFNYGCVHGFFEKVLGKASSHKEAVDRICGTLEENPANSSKFKFYCYHGAGHAIMMSQAYDLEASLGVCDSLEGPLAQSGCWQGVFMENVGAQAEGKAREGLFSKEDPLAPCNRVAEKYQRECYINHHGYLFGLYGWNMDEAVQACLRADAPQARVCLEGVGLATTSNVWQKILMDNPSDDLEANGWALCQRFPADYVESCVSSGVVHILQLDRFDLTRAEKFCGIVGSSYQEPCYRRVGETLRSESPNAQSAANHCTQLPAHGQISCRRGVSSYTY